MNTKPINIEGLGHFFSTGRNNFVHKLHSDCLLKKRNLTIRVLRYFSFRGTVHAPFKWDTILISSDIYSMNPFVRCAKTHSAQQSPVLRNDRLVHTQRILQHSLRPLCL
jgi:hypothetical protein